MTHPVVFTKKILWSSVAILDSREDLIAMLRGCQELGEDLPIFDDLFVNSLVVVSDGAVRVRPTPWCECKDRLVRIMYAEVLDKGEISLSFQEHQISISYQPLALMETYLSKVGC